MNKALVLVDIQNIYFTEGLYKLYKPEEAANNAYKVLKEFRKHNLPVIHVKHFFDTNGYKEDEKHLRDFYPVVYPKSNEIIVEKNYPDSFLKTNLKEVLDKNKIDELVIAGMMSHMCIDTTVRSAKSYGYNIKVIEDGCTTLDLKYKNEVIKADVVTKTILASLQGVFADIISSDYLIL